MGDETGIGADLLGKHVLLRPAEDGLEPFVAQVVGLSSDGVRQLKVRWYYRPADVARERSVPADVLPNEIFYAAETDRQPEDAVDSLCTVLFGNQEVDPGAWSRANSEPLFVCRREFVPGTREIRPLPADIAGSSAVPAQPEAQDHAPDEDGSRKKRRKTTAPEASSDGLPPPSAQRTKGSLSPITSRSPRKSQSLSSHATDNAGAPPASLLGAARAGSSPTPSPAGSDPGAQTEDSAAQRCVPASVLGRGRWSVRRYEAGRAALVRILREMGALSGMTAVLRPVLRETARRAIGDTGLLDHLLKHMADQVVSAEGDFLRRQHNKEGHMVYWLQSPSQAELAGELLKNEVSALSSELQELKEARQALSAAKAEAVQALQSAASPAPARAEDTPRQTASPFTRPAPGAEALAARVESVAADVAAVNSSVLAGLEEVRSESAGLARLTGEHLRKVVAGVETLARRHAGLESHVLQLEDAGGGRLEALVSAAREIGDVRERVAGLEARMQMVELVVLGLKTNMEATLAACREPPGMRADQYQDAGPSRDARGELFCQGPGQDPMLAGGSYGPGKRDIHLDRLRQHAA